MKIKVFLLCLFLLLIALYFVFDVSTWLSLENLKTQKEALLGVYQKKPVVVVLAYSLVYVVITALGLPAAVLLTLAGGAVFGFWLGVIIVSIVSTMGATLAFLMSRYLLRDYIQTKFGENMESINAGLKQEGALYVFGLRLVPVFPFFAVNALLGLSQIKTFTYIWASQLGMLLGTAVYVNAGTQLASIDSIGDIFTWKIAVSFALLGVFPLLAKKIIAYIKRSKQSSGE